MSKISISNAPRLKLWERMLRALLAGLFVLFHSYCALVVLGEGMVNEGGRTGTPYALTLEIGIGSACLVSLLFFVGAILGWRQRIILLLGVLLVVPWFLIVWLI